MDIGTEELSHREVVGALIRMHLKPMKSSREAAEADPLGKSRAVVEFPFSIPWGMPGLQIT